MNWFELWTFGVVSIWSTRHISCYQVRLFKFIFSICRNNNSIPAATKNVGKTKHFKLQIGFILRQQKPDLPKLNTFKWAKQQQQKIGS